MEYIIANPEAQCVIDLRKKLNGYKILHLPKWRKWNEISQKMKEEKYSDK